MSDTRIVLVAAISRNGVIGVDNKMPWHYPGDLKLFKEFTTGHSVVMGRKTWESLPPKFRPLPNRQNWVLSRDEAYRAKLRAECPTVYCAAGMGVLDAVAPLNKQWCIIGGGELYRVAMRHADALELTIVPEKYPHTAGTVLFPDIDEAVWELKHACPHPYEPALQCARYERRIGTKEVPSDSSV